jgi:tetratricopeptide (TPR) repeat protein
LWRGEALTHVGYDALRVMFLPHLDELRLRLRELLIDAHLALKEFEQVLPELTALAERHPLRDPLHERRFVALYGAGRRDDAQRLYQNVRILLRDELGAEPSAVLRELFQMALLDAPESDLVDMLVAARRGGSAASAAASADATAAAAAAAAATATATATATADATGVEAAAPPAAVDTPHRSTLLDHQFPPPPRRFVGREAKLAELSAAMADNDAPEQAGTVLLVGMAGVGKTALALTWAHRVADQYPDGLLYVNLNGFAEHGMPLTTDAAVRILLDCLGVPAHQLPGTPEGRIALYHRNVAHKRILLILDNTRDADQVRPLLPRTGGLRVVVTSRHTLASLVTHLFARTVRLAPLTTCEARALLELRLGPERTLGMEDAVAAVAERCAHLPLALVVAAGRAWSRPDIPLDVLAGQLTAGLGELDDGDPAVSVRTVLSWSYRQLSPAAARLFRLFAVHPGPDVSVPAAAGLAAISRAAAGAALTELASMNMVGESTPGRFSLHSILREFALECAADDEPEAELESAGHRLFDSYLHSAIHANNALTTQPAPDKPTPLEPAPGSDVTEFDARDSGTATRWFAAEREVLANLISVGAAQNRDLFVWQMVCAQAAYLGTAVRYEENMDFVRMGLRSARVLGDTVAEAHLHLLLGRDLARLGDTGGSLAHLDQAKRAYEAADDVFGIASTHRTMANVWYVTGDHEAACQGMAKYLEFSRATGQPRAEAMALNALGWFHAHLEAYDTALELLHEALDIVHTTGDDIYSYHIWDSVGFVHHRRGDHDKAIAAYTAAITTSRVRGAEHQAALGHLRIGDVYRDAGDLDAAEENWTVALKLSVEQRWPEMEDARERLAWLEMGRSVA